MVFSCLFPLCSLFVEDKGCGGTGSGGRAESQESKRLFSWKCPGNEATNLEKGEHRAGGLELAPWRGQSRGKKDNRAGSFPAGIGHCWKLGNTEIFFN